MTDFSHLMTCEKYRFSNRNASNDADIVKPVSVRKIPTFTVQEPFCRFARMSFLPRNLTAALPCSLSIGEVFARSYPIRTVIQLSGQLFALTLINWEFIFDLNEVNFVNFPQMTKRAGTQHIKSVGDNLSLYL